MKITVLGCSGSVPGPGLPTSGYLVEADGFRIVADLGAGTFGKLQTHCSPFDLDAVLLSHLHLDHCADFAALTTFRRHHPRPPYDPSVRKLPVHAPSGASVLVYETENAGTAKNTALLWTTGDLAGEVARLREAGVVFEEYDLPGLKTENGIATNDQERAAWFKDSEGNILCVAEERVAQEP